MKEAKVLRPDTDYEERVELPGDPQEDAYSFDLIRKVVGGYLEVVHVNEFDVYVDEDGISKNLQRNTAASIICGHQVVGVAVVVTR